jgi:hypothetical protein
MRTASADKGGAKARKRIKSTVKDTESLGKGKAET